MLHRCFNPKHPQYKDYGGRGIGVWHGWVFDYPAFIGHVGFKPSPELTLDRIDNNRDYEPGNIRLTDRKTQQRNLRSNRSLTAFGQTKLMCEWTDQYGISSAHINARLRCGWTCEKAVSDPIRKGGKHVKYEVDGFSMTRYGHALRVGIDPQLVYKRLARGMTIEEALR